MAWIRCISCQKIPEGICDKGFSMFTNRLRFLSFRQGALQLRFDILLPVVVITGGLLVGTVSFYMTIISLIGMPAGLTLYYQMWLKDHHKERTKVFYAWGLYTTFIIFFIYQTMVIPFREVLLWENLLLSTIFGLMMYCLYFARCDPGYLQKGQAEDTHMDDKDLGKPDVEEETKKYMAENPLANTLVANFGFDSGELGRHVSAKVMHYREIGEAIEEADVVWVDSRPVVDGVLVTWCSSCYAKLTQRSGHCPVCSRCVQGRDHHCVWIDNCVGDRNHRSFLMALILLIVGGYYGSHLTLTTICTPKMYYNWFLLPSDCRFVYSDFVFAICYVSSLHCIIMCTGMLAILIDQLINISQNITSLEMYRATKRGWVKYRWCAERNFNNRGFIRNWRDFLSGRRCQNYPSVPV